MGFQSDYILRLIEMMGVLLERIMGRVASGEPAEALELADDAIGELTGLPAGTVDTMSGEGIVAFLSAGGTLDADVAEVLAALFEARASAREAMEDAAGVSMDRQRAEALRTAVSGISR